MRIINENLLLEDLFRFGRENVLTDSWFIGETGEMRQKMRKLSPCSAAIAMLDMIGKVAGGVDVSELAVSRRELHPSRSVYSTLYVAAEGEMGIAPQRGVHLVQQSQSQDISAVLVWMSAECQVKAWNGKRTSQILPFVEIVVVEEDSHGEGDVTSVITSPITSLWSQDNRAAMLLIWILADAQLRQRIIRPGTATDWTLLNEAVDRTRGDLGAAAMSLPPCPVNDADLARYESCAMMLPDDSAVVHENTALAEANRALRRVWDAVRVSLA